MSRKRARKQKLEVLHELDEISPGSYADLRLQNIAEKEKKFEALGIMKKKKDVEFDSKPEKNLSKSAKVGIL